MVYVSGGVSREVHTLFLLAVIASGAACPPQPPPGCFSWLGLALRASCWPMAKKKEPRRAQIITEGLLGLLSKTCRFYSLVPPP